MLLFLRLVLATLYFSPPSFIFFVVIYGVHVMGSVC